MALRYPSQKHEYMQRYVAETTTPITNGDTIALTDRVFVRCTFTGTGLFYLENGSEDGQIRIIMAESTSGNIEITDASSGNTLLHTGKWKPNATGSVISIIWDAFLNKWIELYRNNI